MGEHLYHEGRPQEVVRFFEKAQTVLGEDEEETTLPDGSVETGHTKLHKGGNPLIILPTLEKYASIIGSSPRVLQNWKKKHPEFGEAVEICMAIQKNMLLQLGLNNHYNSSIAKLILTNCHDYTQKAEVTTKGAVVLNFDEQDRDS